MSAREWKPGDVVRLKGHGLDTAAIYTDRGSFAWVDPVGGNPGHVSLCHPTWGGDVRPLIVIDPEDAEQVERLSKAYLAALPIDLSGTAADLMQAALREFANPTPPKPDEPQGLGAVVEDATGGLWLRWSRADFKPWVTEDPTGHDVAWCDLAAVRVLSPGVEVSP